VVVVIYIKTIPIFVETLNKRIMKPNYIVENNYFCLEREVKSIIVFNWDFQIPVIEHHFTSFIDSKKRGSNHCNGQWIIKYKNQ